MVLFDNVPIWVKGAKRHILSKNFAQQMQCCCSTMYRFEFAVQLYVHPLAFIEQALCHGIGIKALAMA
jgi:hypothetical protein